MALQLRFAAVSDVGLVRRQNEDSGFAGPGVLAIADGMGGHAAGEVASAAVVGVVAQLPPPASDSDPSLLLRDTIAQAGDRLREMVVARPELDGMGTTLTMILQAGDRVAIAQVGDSRGYLLREGVLERVTHDQTFVQTLVDSGRISVEEARTHPQRSLLLQALDGRVEVEPVIVVRTLRAGDRYLLCSDGLSSFVTEATIRDQLAVGTPREAADRLVDLALRTGAPDNVTVVVADVVDEPLDAGTQGPQTVGAAAEARGHQDAARLGDAAPVDSDERTEVVETAEAAAASESTADAEHGEGDDEEDGHRHSFRLLVPVILLVVLAGVGAFAAYRWTQEQYYVGVHNGQVAIYRGVPQQVAGRDLSHVVEPTDVQASMLPSYSEDQVQDTIAVGSVAEARRIVDGLRAQASACSTTPSPEGCPSPSTGSSSPGAGAPSAGTTVSPTPSTTPVASVTPQPSSSVSP